MFEQLFGSKTRVKLLRLFLTNPDKAYFIRELTRRIDTQINSVRRELENLLQCDIVATVRKAPTSESFEVVQHDKNALMSQSKKYFKANTDFVLFKELSVLFSKSPLLLQNQFIREMKHFGNIDYAVMTGFFVGREDCSVDLLIVGDIQKQKLLKFIQSFEKEFEREINYSTMTREEFLYRRGLTDRFLFGILEGKRIIVVDHLN